MCSIHKLKKHILPCQLITEDEEIFKTFYKTEILSICNKQNMSQEGERIPLSLLPREAPLHCDLTATATVQNMDVLYWNGITQF